MIIYNDNEAVRRARRELNAFNTQSKRDKIEYRQCFKCRQKLNVVDMIQKVVYKNYIYKQLWYCEKCMKEEDK